MNPAIQLARILVRKPTATVVTRTMATPAPWNYLWMPGPYPETPEERAAAARKYGMLLEDYKPYPKDSDMMSGDYPNLPVDAMLDRDRLYNWDMPEFRRNYGEPLQADWEMYHETRFSPMSSARYTRLQQFMCQVALFIFIVSIIRVGEGDFGIPKLTHPRMAAQRLDEGPSYTFEQLE